MEDSQEQHGGGEEPPASTEPTVSAWGRRGGTPFGGGSPQFGGEHLQFGGVLMADASLPSFEEGGGLGGGEEYFPSLGKKEPILGAHVAANSIFGFLTPLPPPLGGLFKRGWK